MVRPSQVVGQLAGRLAGYLLLAAATASLLNGCTAPARVAGPVTSPAERRAAIAAVSNWEARGRIALKTPGTSGQGNFAWTQTGDRTVLRVAGPFGSGAYEIRWDPQRLTVLSKTGEVAADYTGPDAAERFLAEQLGWTLPVANARYWLLGLAGPATTAAETLDEAGLLAVLAQDGWDVTYGEYRPAGRVSLPRKLVMSGGASRIRLVIDDWQF